MADTSSTINLIISGSVRGVTQAAAAARTAIASIGSGLTKLGAAGGAVNAIGGAVAAVQQLAGAALLLPAAIGAAVAAKATFVLATQGFTDAVGGDAEALAKLAPSAREAAVALQQLRDGPIRDLQQSVQQAFFEGFAADIQQLSDFYLPTLKTGMTDIATQFASVRQQTIQGIINPANLNDVNEILAGTAGFLREVGGAIGDVISGFLGIAGVGATFLPQLGTAIGGVALRFREWVDSAVESGRITEIIETAIAAFQDLGTIVQNVGGILRAVFQGLAGDVGSPLGALAELTGRLREFFETAEAQTALSALGNALRVVASVVGDLLIGALKAIAPIVTALTPLIVGLAQTFGTIGQAILDSLGPAILTVVQSLSDALLPVLPTVAEALSGLARALGPLIEALAGPFATILATVIQLFADIVIALTPVIEALTPVVELIAGALADALELIAPMLAEVAVIIADAMVLAIQTLAPLLPPLLDAFLGLIEAVVPLIPPLVELAVNLLPLFTLGVQIALPIVSALIAILTTLIETFAPLIQAVLEFVNNALAQFNTFTADVSTVIGDMTQAVVDFFQGLFDDVSRIVTDLVTGVTTFFEDCKTAVEDTVNTLVESVKTFFSDMKTNVETAVNDMVTAVTDFFENLKTDAVAAVQKLFDDVTRIIGDLVRGFIDAAGRAVDGFVQGIKDGVGRVGEAARNLAQSALDALGIPLEIGSPSKAAKRFGRWTGEGLALGLDSMTGDVIASARALGLAANGALSSTLSAPDLGGVTSGAGALAGTSTAVSAALNADASARAQQTSELVAALGRSGPQEVAVTVLLDGEPVAAIARVELQRSDRETVRRARVGSGVSF